MRGIILIAAGANYYGRMAHQLAVSLRITSPHIPIALLYNDTAIASQVPLDAFDYAIPLPEKAVMAGKQLNYFKAKSFLFDLTPFKETIYVDVDMVSLRNFNQLFDQLSDQDFAIQNAGFVGMSGDVLREKYTWGSLHEIKSAYDLETPFYNLQSEFIYFKKDKEVKKIFDEAKKIFDKPKISFRQFAGGLPDELAFSIALSKLNKSVQSPYNPVYWETAQQKKLYRDRTTLFANYFGFSLGGHFISEYALECYRDIMNNQWNKMGLPGRPLAVNKRKFVPGRESH